MRSLSRSLWASKRLFLSRDLSAQRKFHFNAVPPNVSRPFVMSPWGRRFQSTTVEETNSERSEILSATSLTPSSINDSVSTSSEISPLQHSNDPAQEKGHMPRIAYIAIGSNIGNRILWIERALEQMKIISSEMIVKRTSSLWETEPMYVTDQEKFLNGVIEVLDYCSFIDHD